MSNERSFAEQNRLIYESLDGEQKRIFFESFFESQIVFELKRQRKAAGLSQTQLAKAMGVKQSQVSKIENLEKTPTIETIGKYIFALHYTLQEANELALSISNVNPEKLFTWSVSSKDYTSAYRVNNPKELALALR